MATRRRKLIAFTDTKSRATQRKNQFQKKGFTKVEIKKEFGGFSVFGLSKKRRKKK